MLPHILIALENEPYPHDRRVRQEAEALRDHGYTVTVCGPTGFGFDAREEDIDGVHVLRYRPPPGGRGIAGYIREYLISLAHLGALMRRAHKRQRVDTVIVCSPPDLIVVPALPLRRAGSALILDHHDLSPELFEAKFGPRRALKALVRRGEALALGVADAVIAPNETYAEVERRRGNLEPERGFIVRNGPDPARIYPVPPRPELKLNKRLLVCWVGMMSQQEGLHHLLGAADELVHRRGRSEIGFALVGVGDARDQLIAQAAALALKDSVWFPGRVGDELLRDYICTADVCVAVDEPNPMNDASTMTKVIEYMLLGRPIIQFPLRETQRVCGDASLYVSPGDARALADGIEELLSDPPRAELLGARARQRALDGLLWPQQIPALLEAVTEARRLRDRRCANARP